MPRKNRSSRPRLKRVSVRAEVRDEPDWDRFAFALLQHVKRTSAPSTKPGTRSPKP